MTEGSLVGEPGTTACVKHELITGGLRANLPWSWKLWSICMPKGRPKAYCQMARGKMWIADLWTSKGVKCRSSLWILSPIGQRSDAVIGVPGCQSILDTAALQRVGCPLFCSLYISQPPGCLMQADTQPSESSGCVPCLTCYYGSRASGELPQG